MGDDRGDEFEQDGGGIGRLESVLIGLLRLAALPFLALGLCIWLLTFAVAALAWPFATILAMGQTRRHEASTNRG